MKAKLKLRLSGDELRALDSHMEGTLVGHAIEELRLIPQDFLICSNLYELHEKTSAKVKELKLFPTRRTDALYTLTMTRSQALALYCTILTDDPQTDETVSQSAVMLPFATETFESNFLQGLLGKIHQTFLI